MFHLKNRTTGVDFGIALGSKPEVLLLDEPLAGLAATERERVANLIKTISTNIPVLLVEHDIDRVLALSRRVTMMNKGQALMTGAPDEVRNGRRVQEIYTGKGVPPATGRKATAATEQLLLQFEKVNSFYGKATSLTTPALCGLVAPEFGTVACNKHTIGQGASVGMFENWHAVRAST